MWISELFKLWIIFQICRSQTTYDFCSYCYCGNENWIICENLPPLTVYSNAISTGNYTLLINNEEDRYIYLEYKQQIDGLFQDVVTSFDDWLKNNTHSKESNFIHHSTTKDKPETDPQVIEPTTTRSDRPLIEPNFKSTTYSTEQYQISKTTTAYSTEQYQISKTTESMKYHTDLVPVAIEKIDNCNSELDLKHKLFITMICVLAITIIIIVSCTKCKCKKKRPLTRPRSHIYSNPEYDDTASGDYDQIELQSV